MKQIMRKEIDVRLKEIKPGMAVKCKTKEEAIALWMWFYENGYV